jgi:hypothetical protein
MPRTWEERMAVDYNQVLSLIDAGITQDFAPQGFLTGVGGQLSASSLPGPGPSVGPRAA